MLHLGDITKISGYTAPIVDVVVGGSPCQDLSVAGKRAGLDGERSGLFMEQLRIIKEMRERDRRTGRTDEHIRPRSMVWENVPGAFSSNKSEDFRIVLEETAKVCGKDAVIPMPDKGKWTTSGCILGDGWSIAWRVLDAQFYGVPQRRRRIALVADFGGHSAPEILFIRKNVSRDTQPSQPQASDASRGTGADDIYCIDGDKLNKKERKGGSGIGYREGDKQYTLTAKDVHGVAYCFEPGAAKRLGGYVWEDLAPTLRTEVGDNRPSVAYTMQDREGKAGGNVPMVMNVVGVDSYNLCETGEQTHTLTASKADNEHIPLVMALDRASFNQGKNALYDFEVSDKGINSPLVAKGPSAVAIAAVDCRNCTENSDINGTLQSHMSGGSSLNLNNVVRVKYIVRRLTPLECERLQGYPDNWTLIGEPTQKVVEDFDEDTGEKEGEHIETEFYYTNSQGKRVKASDAARYKALGNSIALPPWKWVLKRLCACYERDATLASLFDGIGGFPYLWEQLNGKGSCLWASEIEEFPMAVTKKRIGG